VVLTGVHLGSWGQDLHPQKKLGDLVRMILYETDLPRLRLSSLEPWDLDEGFLGLWQNPRLCRHLHLPVQSGCATTLQRMQRKTTPEAFTRLVGVARAMIPDLAITTDIIVGFPGESDAEFEESLEFVKQMKFAGGHVFNYSPRPGTVASRMAGQVPPGVRKQRSLLMREVLAESAQAFRAGFLGQVLSVLWESAASLGPQGWEMSGLTDNYLRVHASSPVGLWNQILQVRLISMGDGCINGEFIAG
jgi:threonylcarbamoyladenosine tRNA methylthiotransferase MtaB